MTNEERLNRVEANLRWAKRVVFCLCVLLIAGVAVGAQAPFVDLVCNSLAVKNKDGKTVILMKSDGSLSATGKLTIGGDLIVNGKPFALPASVAVGSPPIGSVIAFAGQWHVEAEMKTGWMLCDGRDLNPNDYQDLFKAIGYANGKTDKGAINDFRLPDYRGRFLRGVNNGLNGATVARHDPDATKREAVAGGNAGDNVGSYQADQLKVHTHGVGRKVALQSASPGRKGEELSKVPVENRDQFNTDNGEGLGLETRPRNVSVHWIIRFK